MYVCLVGNLSEGFSVVGPYADFDEATIAHPGADTWVMTLNAPSDGLSSITGSTAPYVLDAASCLLAACEAFVAACDTGETPGWHGTSELMHVQAMEAAEKAARIALAKAKGE